MTLRMTNIRFGFVVLFITAVAGGLALGGTFNQYSIKDGYHMLEMTRFWLREGHSHGNFMALFNLFVGIIINNLDLSDKLKKVGSYAAMTAIFLPMGLFLNGVFGADNVPPVGIIGILGVATALIILIIGSFKTAQKS